MEGMKHYGWGVIDKEGIPVRSFRDSEVETARRLAEFHTEAESIRAPYRVVELLYSEDQP